REPSASPESKSGRMLGWLSPAARRISRRKRSGPNDWPRSARRTLSATWRSWRISCPRYTVAIPPVPSSRTRRYRPVRAAPSRSADELGASRDIFRRLVGPESRRGGASHGGLLDQEDTSSGRSRHSERLARLRHGGPRRVSRAVLSRKQIGQAAFDRADVASGYRNRPLASNVATSAPATTGMSDTPNALRLR